MKSIIKWKNYLSIYIIVLVLANIGLLYLPLVNVFGYEFSVINSMLLVIFTGIYTIKYYDTFFTKNNHLFTSELFESSLLLLLIPFTVSIINSLINGFCSFIDGLLFYLVITLPSIIIGMALGMLAVFLSKRFRIFWLFLLYLGILSIIFWEIFINPQVYVFNPIIGFFPGTIYDEGISVSWNLVLYRLFNIIFFGYILKSIIKIKRGKSTKLVPFLISTILLVIFYFFSPKLGYATTKSYLDQQLYRQVISDHFIIHYDNKIGEKQIKILALNQEYYYQQLKDFFDLDLKEKIHTYLFFNDLQKKELFGSKNADVAKPWLNHIYISYDSWEHTLKHEMAHCFSGAFGSGIFKLAAGLNPLLIEGIAEAADGIYDENSIHYMAALAYNSNYKEDIEFLLSKSGFFSRTSSLSYIYAGSFIKHLVDEEGIQKFKQYYVSGEFQEVYGIELKSFLDGYYKFLYEYKGDINLESANYYFGRKSLFQKVCPRSISENLQMGWEQINNSDYLGAEKTFWDVLGKADNYSALVGLARSFEEQDKITESVELLLGQLNKFEKTSYYYNLEFFLADFYSKLENFAKADSLYSSIAFKKPNRRLNYLANVRKNLIRNNHVKKYLSGSDYDKYYILKSLNKFDNNYWSFPILITLTKQLDEDYDYFIEDLNMNIRVSNYESSYAILKLSQYMLSNYDFANARKFAGLALRYNSDENFNYILSEQFDKANWYYQNGQLTLNTLRLINNN